MKKKNPININSTSRLDKTAFWAGSFKEARQRSDGSNLTPMQRLRLATKLSYAAYGYTEENRPGLDRTVFSMRGRK